MSGEFYLGADTITRVRAPLARSTRDNSEYRDWAHASRVDINNCMVEPFLPSNRLLVEVSSGREFEQEPYRVYIPPTADVTYTDRIEYRGDSYDVVVDPAPWTDLDGDLSFYTFVMRLREG